MSAMDMPLIDAYARRLGRTAPWGAPTLEQLRELHRAHVAAVPFENLDVLLGRTIALDGASLRHKLIDARRGGYCFEQNGLLYDVLCELGYPVRPLLARVLFRATTPRPRTHRVQLVRIAGQDWLADVGFGLQGLLEPLLLEDGLEQRQGLWTFRALRDVDEHETAWRLQAWLPALPGEAPGWQDLYRVGLEPQGLPDFELANHYTSTHPASRFLQTLIVARGEPARRQRLLDLEFSVETAAGLEVERVGDERRFASLLADGFGLELAPDSRRRLWDFLQRKAEVQA